MPYTYQPYPAYRYGPSGQSVVVKNVDEDNNALAEGFATHPSLVGVKANPVEEQAPEPVTEVAPVAPVVPAPVVEPIVEPAPTKAKKAAAKAVKAEAAADKAQEAAAKVIEAETPFDRAAAILTLEAADYVIPPETTDDELKDALAELAKG